jgi:hypothetical protein
MFFGTIGTNDWTGLMPSEADDSFFNPDQSLWMLWEVNAYRERIFYYLVFLVALEFALRLIVTVATFLMWDRRLILKQRAVNDHKPGPPPDADPIPDEWGHGPGGFPATQPSD